MVRPLLEPHIQAVPWLVLALARKLIFSLNSRKLSSEEKVDMLLTVLLPYHRAGRSISMTEKRAHAARRSEKATGPTVPAQVTRSCHGRAATAPRFSLGRICCSHRCTTSQPPAPAPSPSATAGIHRAHGWTGPENGFRFRGEVNSCATVQKAMREESGTNEDASICLLRFMLLKSATLKRGRVGKAVLGGPVTTKS